MYANALHIHRQPFIVAHMVPYCGFEAVRAQKSAWERLPAPIPWPDVVTQHSVVSAAQPVVPPRPQQGGDGV